MFLRKSLLFISVCFLVLTHTLFAQITVQGVVRDNAAEPVANALVALIDQADSSRVFSSTTNVQGQYSIQITTTDTGDVPEQIPNRFELLQNYPNPFNPSTVISYEIPYPAHVRIEIYNVLGQKIRTLFDGYQSNLYGRVVWDATNDQNLGVATGVYIYSLVTDECRLNRKMLLLDGHLGKAVAAGSFSAKTSISDQPGLRKATSSKYLLRVSGTDIVTWKQDIQIKDNKQLDVFVIRIGSVTDIDGNVYKTVLIGNLWWMAENLKVTHYRNGDLIFNKVDFKEWEYDLKIGAYCYYDNDSSYAVDYGALYNWYAVYDTRSIAPDGWHVPTEAEWQQLEMYLGMTFTEADNESKRGYDEGGKLKEIGVLHWNNPNIGATNESGFTARPGGYWGIINSCELIGTRAFFWTATENSNDYAWIRSVATQHPFIIRYPDSKKCYMSVRCVKYSSPPSTIPYIKITPDTIELPANAPRQFTCTAINFDSTARNVTALTIWSVTPGIAGSINSTGLFTPYIGKTGIETITATYQGQTAQAVVTVKPLETGTVTDIDGNVYRTVKIGNQWWMAENLKVIHYCNGEQLPNVSDYVAWKDLTTGAYCYYDNDTSHAAVYGVLYNWCAVGSQSGLAPAGWHVPNTQEWQMLIEYLGGDAIAGGKLKETGTMHWTDPNTGATNESGFSAMPGGQRGYYSNVNFNGLGNDACFWSTTIYYAHLVDLFVLNCKGANIYISADEYRCGFSVRCVKD